jgi:hypothetical protein
LEDLALDVVVALLRACPRTTTWPIAVRRGALLDMRKRRAKKVAHGPAVKKWKKK